MAALKRAGLLWGFVLFGTFLLPSPLVGQTFRGGIQGTVTDSTGAALPGADVTATNVGTGLTRTVVTDSEGNYFIPELPLGDYSVKANLSGFGPQTVSGVRVVVSAMQRVNFQLTPGGVQETVEVKAAVPLIETTGNTLGGTIEARQAAELPINGRDFTKLLVLLPGSGGDASGAADSPGSFGLFSVNGSRGRSNNYLLDGTDMNDGYRNLPAINEGGVFGTPATVLPVEALAEIRVLSGTQAEYGRNSGAIVNIVTKSGTNTPHGSLYEFFRDDALGSRNYFNAAPQPKNNFRNNQFGGSFGGPIVHDRTFFFAAYEGQRESAGLPSLARVPDPAVLATATNPVIRSLVALNPWPAPNIAGAGAGEPNLQAVTNASNRVDSLILKLDQHIGQSDLLTGRYFLGDSDQSFPLGLGGGNILPGYNTITPTRVHVLSLSYIHMFTPKLLFEARGGYNHFYEQFLPEDRSFDPRTIGLNTVSDPQDFGMPKINVAEYAGLGSSIYNPRGRTDTNTHLVGAFSYSTGRHNVKGGYEFRRTTVDGFFNAGYRSQLNFASLEDFLAGNVDSGRQALGDSQRFTFQDNHGLYFQDDFAATSRLTLNYGLRWDYMGVIGEQKNRLSILDPSGNLVQVGTSGLARLYPRDLKNFAPRASVVYDLTGKGKTVLRGSWGIFYDAFSQDFFVGQIPWNSFSPGPAYNDVGGAGVLFSYSPVATLEPDVPVFDTSTFAASDVWTVSQELRTPYMQNYNVNVEHQLGPYTGLQVGYVGSIGRRLYRFRDINQLDPTTGAPPPFPAYVYVNQFESTATSTYNALQVSFNVRNWKGLTSRADYTLGHSVDNASDGQDYVPNASQPDNSFNPEAERADSNFDTRHRFTLSFTYELPSSPGASRLRSGWAINGVLTLSGGQPFNVNYLYEGDYNGSGEFFGRPDLVGDPWAGTSAPDKYLNLAAFAVPCTWDPAAGDCVPGTQHFGNLPRNAFHGPSYRNFDLSIVKNTALRGNTRLQFRVDIFNLLNTANFTNPMMPNYSLDFLSNGTDPATGRGVGYLPLTATPDVAIGNPFLGGGGSRNIQLVAKLIF